MCGIVAIWHTSAVDQDKLKAATISLRHRGPDGQKIWISANKQVGLGHARLSIVDLVTGSQPLESTNRKIHAVVNGEFYDDDQIRKSLLKKGYEFKTHSDSEILLPLYQEYGLDCFDHLNGEFAFVLWDEKKQQLLAARDRFGIKPLYYTQYQNNLYFASEVKALLTLGVPAKWNEDIYWQQFYSVPLANQSCFKGIYQIKPGNYILVQSGKHKFKLEEKPYWKLTFPSIKRLPKELSEEEYCEQFRVLMGRAVKRRLRADVSVASYLSGGIDSSSVLATMAELSVKPIDVFNVAFVESPELNEHKMAKLVARHVGAEFHSLPVTMTDIAKHYADTVWHTEVFHMHGSPVAKYLLSKLVHDANYKVVLTGEGADELLAGYPPLWADCVKYSDDSDNQPLVPFFNESILKDRNGGRYFKPHRKSVIDKLGYYPGIFKQISPRIQGLLNKDFLDKYGKRNPYVVLLRDFPTNTHITHGNMSIFIQCKTGFPIQTLNVVADRTEMAHSIEGRPPFLDKDLAEFCIQLPTHYKARNMVDKYILRQAMKHKLPHTTYKKNKHPFLSPTFFYSRDKLSALYQLMQDVFHSDMLLQVPFIDPASVIKTIDHLPRLNKEKVQELEPFLHLILSSCFLAHQFKISS